MTYEQLSKLAEQSGFTAWVPLDVSTMEVRTEVRDMCLVNTCGNYNTRWCCPPGCGTLEECAERLKGYTRGILVQTCGDVEDGLDFEAIMQIAADHAQHFSGMHKVILESGEKVLAMGTANCAGCTDCTYPDAPCRYPDTMVASLSGYGIIVMDLCKANGLQYYYGPEKLAYTGCFLIRD